LDWNQVLSISVSMKLFENLAFQIKTLNLLPDEITKRAHIYPYLAFWFPYFFVTLQT